MGKQKKKVSSANETAAHIGLVAIRTAQNTSHSPTKQIKHAALIHRSPLKSIDQNKFAMALQEAGLDEIPGNRPVATITERNERNSPIGVKTPGGTHMTRKGKNKLMSFFDNRQNAESTDNKENKRVAKSLFSEEQDDGTSHTTVVKPPETAHKEKKLHITTKHLRPAGKRVVTQNVVMGDSAKHHIEHYQKDMWVEHIAYEWLHLIAHKLLKDKAQTADNLVAGTAHANTDMLMIEEQIKKLVHNYKTCHLEVEAMLIPDTHIASQINYKFTLQNDTSHEPLVLDFSFDAQTTHQPIFVQMEYINKIFDTLIKVEKQQHDTSLEKEEVQSEQNGNRSLCSFFYSKSTSAVHGHAAEDQSTQPSSVEHIKKGK